MEIDYSSFLNVYDIFFLIICLISIFFGIKNGFIKSFFNLAKWILIFYIIKNCFTILRPYIDPYISNQTISDIVIFLATLIISYIILSSLIRIIIGIMQPKKSGLIDFGFGAVLGIFRGYVIFILLIFFLSKNVAPNYISDIKKNSSFNDIIEYGVDLIDYVPRELDKIDIKI